MKIKPCPFCGETPDIESVSVGNQYEVYCDCGHSMSCVQICDLMTIEERMGDDFVNNEYKQVYQDRARKEVIKQWNKRVK